MTSGGIISFKDDDVEKKIIPSIEASANAPKKNGAKVQMVENLKVLCNAGLLPKDFLIGGNRYFEVAVFLGLFDLELTLSRFEVFQNGIGQLAGWFD
jgi:hypothetical protein